MNCYKTYVIGIIDSILGIINYETVGILWNPNGFALFKLNNVTVVQPGASDAVLIGGAQPPEINASDLTATPYVLEEAFTRAGSFSS